MSWQRDLYDDFLPHRWPAVAITAAIAAHAATAAITTKSATHAQGRLPQVLSRRVCDRKVRPRRIHLYCWRRGRRLRWHRLRLVWQ